MKIVVIEATQVRALCEEKAIALDFVGDAHAEDLREIAYDADALETFNGESGDEVVAIEIVEGVVVAGRRYRVKPVQGE